MTIAEYKMISDSVSPQSDAPATKAPVNVINNQKMVEQTVSISAIYHPTKNY
jgi:hypothetical protein